MLFKILPIPIRLCRSSRNLAVLSGVTQNQSSKSILNTKKKSISIIVFLYYYYYDARLTFSTYTNLKISHMFHRFVILGSIIYNISCGNKQKLKLQPFN